MISQNQTESYLEEQFRRADLNAADEFDFERLQRPSAFFLPLQLTAEKETLRFVYDTDNLHPFMEIKKEDALTIYAALSDAADLWSVYKEFDFSLNPDNLYFDIHAKVCVKSRDIRSEEPLDTVPEQRFLDAYRALIGATLQNRYRFEDYLQGGLELLKKDHFLSQIYSADSIDEIKTLLLQAFRKEKVQQQNRFRLVKKRSYFSRTMLLIVMTMAAAICAIVLIYLLLGPVSERRSELKAYRYYYDSDFIQVIDSLQEHSLAHMDIHTKCILAISYIKSENLTAEQKENILNQININGNAKYMDYWIELGRGNYSEAENIALQISDNELLLYAYMKERNYVESDDTLDGASKAAQLSQLQSQIDNLAREYEDNE